MLPVASSLILVIRMGTYASGYFWASGGFFTTPGVLVCGRLGAKLTRSGIAGTRKVRLAAALVIDSGDDTYVNGFIGQGLANNSVV